MAKEKQLDHKRSDSLSPSVQERNGGAYGMRYRLYGWSFLTALTLLAATSAVASLPHCDPLRYLFLPGAFLAAVVFPQGIEGNYGITYLVLAGLLDIVLLTLAVARAWRLIAPRWKIKGKNAPQNTPS